MSSQQTRKCLLKGNLQIIEKRGSGRFGTVYKSKWNGQDIALKVINPENIYSQYIQNINQCTNTKIFKQNIRELLSGFSSLVSEYFIISKLPKSEYIVNIRDIITVYRSLLPLKPSEEDLYPGQIIGIVMDLVNGKDLYSYHTNILTENLFGKLVSDIVKGVIHLHSNRIIHGDLHLGNVLIQFDPKTSYKKEKNEKSWYVLNPTAKISDFGQSHVINQYCESSIYEKGMIINLRIQPPEMIKINQFEKTGDVWAFGIMLWEMLTGKRFEPRNISHTYGDQSFAVNDNWWKLMSEIAMQPNVTLEKERKLNLSIIDKYSELVNFARLSRLCMMMYPNYRPNFKQINNMLISNSKEMDKQIRSFQRRIVRNIYSIKSTRQIDETNMDNILNNYSFIWITYEERKEQPKIKRVNRLYEIEVKELPSLSPESYSGFILSSNEKQLLEFKFDEKSLKQDMEKVSDIANINTGSNNSNNDNSNNSSNGNSNGNSNSNGNDNEEEKQGMITEEEKKEKEEEEQKEDEEHKYKHEKEEKEKEKEEQKQEEQKQEEDKEKEKLKDFGEETDTESDIDTDMIHYLSSSDHDGNMYLTYSSSESESENDSTSESEISKSNENENEYNSSSNTSSDIESDSSDSDSDSGETLDGYYF